MYFNFTETRNSGKPDSIADVPSHPKIDPVLLVYDDDKRQGGFKLKVRVNER
jgi:hypothetical protein